MLALAKRGVSPLHPFFNDFANISSKGATNEKVLHQQAKRQGGEVFSADNNSFVYILVGYDGRVLVLVLSVRHIDAECSCRVCGQHLAEYGLYVYELFLLQSRDR